MAEDDGQRSVRFFGRIGIAEAPNRFKAGLTENGHVVLYLRQSRLVERLIFEVFEVVEAKHQGDVVFSELVQPLFFELIPAKRILSCSLKQIHQTVCQ